MKKKHKKRVRRGIAGIILVLVLLLVFLWRRDFAVFSPEPETWLKRYYACVATGDYEEMYGILTKDSQSLVGKEAFLKRNQNIYEGIEAKNIRVQVTGEETKKRDHILTYEVRMDTLAGEISFSNQTVFRFDWKERQYKTDWEDSMIFPELTAEDKVKVSTEKAQRGQILDRNGLALADVGTAYTVGLVPGKMNDDSGGDLERLAELLGMSVEAIQKKLDAGWVEEDSFVPLKTISKLTQKEEFMEDPDEEIKHKKEVKEALLTISGVLLSDTEIREYPLGEAGSHLVGYVQQVTAEDLEEHSGEGYDENSVIGKTGVESLYEEELRGQNGCRIYIENADGQVKKVLAEKNKKDGQDISLTIDSSLQKSIYDICQKDKSCTVAMNLHTGEVLALVSTPSYDSNDFILGMSEDKWKALNEDERNPLYNRFRQKLCPGSSFKPIVAAIGLRTGAIDPEKNYETEGLRWQKDAGWGNYYVTTLHEYEPVTLKNAMIYSDNIFFAKAALRIGKENLERELDRLGFGKEIPFEISLAKSQYAGENGIQSEIQLADSGYGQGSVLVNPIHMAALYTGFANEGNVLKPKLLMGDVSEPAIWIPSAYESGHAQRILDAMTQVISSEHGTGHGIYRKDIWLAGKTGTAEIKQNKEDKNGTELGWFGVYTPDSDIEKPILLMTMVEDVKDRGGSGYVVKIAKTILDGWFEDDMQ